MIEIFWLASTRHNIYTIFLKHTNCILIASIHGCFYYFTILDIDSDGVPRVSLFDTSTDKDINIKEIINKLNSSASEYEIGKK